MSGKLKEIRQIGTLGNKSNIFEGIFQQNEIITPLTQSKKLYDRARELYVKGKGSSSELERVIRDINRASLFIPNDIKHYIFLAKVFKRCHDFASMMNSLSYVLKLDPTNMIAKRLLYEAYIKRGQEYMIYGKSVLVEDEMTSGLYWERAKIMFEEALKLFNDETRIYVFHCLCCIYLKDYETALTSINHCVKDTSNQHHLEILILRVKIYWACGLIDQGNKEIREIAKLNSNHDEVLAYTARCYHSAEYYYKKALNCFRDKSFPEALVAILSALSITEDDVKLHILNSKIYRLMNDYEEAYNSIMKAKSAFTNISNNSNNNNNTISGKINNSKKNHFVMEIPDEIIRQTNLIFNEVALQYIQKGDYERGIVLFNKIISTAKELTNRLLNYKKFQNDFKSPPSSTSTTTLLNGDGGLKSPQVITDRLHELENYPVIDKNNRRDLLIESILDYKYYLNRADCFRALEKYEETISDYLIALKLKPNEWLIKTKLSMIYYLIGIKYFNQSKFQLAEIELTKAIELNPKISEYYAIRGHIRFYLTDYVGTAKDYHKCVELDPTNHEIKLKLQQFEMLEVKQKENHNTVRFLNLIEKSNHYLYKLNKKIEKSMLNNSNSSVKSDETGSYDDILNISQTNINNNNNSKSSSQLLLSEKFNLAILQSIDTKIKKDNVQKLYNKKYDISKNSLVWPLLKSAKDLAKDLEKKNILDSLLPLNNVSTSLTLSSNSLNKYRTKEMDISLIKGIFATREKLKRLKKKKILKNNTQLNKQSGFMQPIKHIRRRKRFETNNAIDSNNTTAMDTGLVEVDDTKQRTLVFPAHMKPFQRNLNTAITLSRQSSSVLSMTSSNESEFNVNGNDDDYSDEYDADEYDLDDNNSEDEHIDIQYLYDKPGESRIVNLLNQSGVTEEWKTSDENNNDSMLLVSEEEELRHQFQLKELENENKLLTEKVSKISTARKSMILSAAPTPMHTLSVVKLPPI